MNKEKTQHTPTPWHVEESADHGIGKFRGIFGPDGFEIVNQHGVLTKSDAAFIVRAVNSHEALLEAARYAFEYLSPKGDVKKDFSGHNAMATLSRAIARAEEETL
jgi:hypothetical protein